MQVVMRTTTSHTENNITQLYFKDKQYEVSPEVTSYFLKRDLGVLVVEANEGEDAEALMKRFEEIRITLSKM